MKEAIKEKTRRAWEGGPGLWDINKQRARAGAYALFASKSILAYFFNVSKNCGEFVK